MKKRIFRCAVCKKKIEVEEPLEHKCGPHFLTGEKTPTHCGKPMVEMFED